MLNYKIVSVLPMLLLSVCCSATSAHSDAIPKNINEFAGRRCNTPKKGSGLVVGYFSGYSDDGFINDDGYQSVDRYRCFPTLSECRGWMYTMESKYGYPPPRITICKEF